MAEIPCAGAIVVDWQGRLLLVRRGRPPGEGLWSVPGGKCELGESPRDACVREALEETGLDLRPVRYAGRVERPLPSGDVFVIHDFVCDVVGGALRAGDDAADARWVSAGELAPAELTAGLLEALIGWATLPAPWTELGATDPSR